MKGGGTKENEQRDNVKKPKSETLTYYPAANSDPKQFNILKFYRFDSLAVSALLDPNKDKIELPFSVTELEHKIITMRPDPPASILLLGRSGTGKTTW